MLKVDISFDLGLHHGKPADMAVITRKPS